jgi:endonuclease YncB( thermonuclease family)
VSRRRATGGRRRLKRGLGLLLLFAAAGWLWADGQPTTPEIRTEDGAIVRVIDGDSLQIGDRRLRLAGYDAPEYRQTCTAADGRAWPCGEAARTRLAALIADGTLTCADHGRDRYGRTLALCRTPAGEIGATMVREGLGERLRGASDSRYLWEEMAARLAGRGIWQGQHQHPADWRDAHQRAEP